MDRTEMLEEAFDLLSQVIDLVTKAVKGTRLERRSEAYVIPTLKMCLLTEHGYLGSQPACLEELIRDLQEEEEEDEEEND